MIQPMERYALRIVVPGCTHNVQGYFSGYCTLAILSTQPSCQLWLVYKTELLRPCSDRLEEFNNMAQLNAVRRSRSGPGGFKENALAAVEEKLWRKLLDFNSSQFTEKQIRLQKCTHMTPRGSNTHRHSNTANLARTQHYTHNALFLRTIRYGECFTKRHGHKMAHSMTAAHSFFFVLQLERK